MSDKKQSIEDFIEFLESMSEAINRVIAEIKEKPSMQIIPASHLTTLPENGTKVIFATTPCLTIGSHTVFNKDLPYHISMFEAKRVYPFTVGGKLGSELRAEEGIIAPL